ncbi:zinc finger protein 33A-like isoform X2 [Polypterus senegalus]|uniref:zinc finger protein 33A-like isoform X2 n=1 Tax=Polypterus senegalus TaxID=55291 RepID=UPI001963CC8C|nr:zinc finger protein 33A-like isoform X2 [Polypterus senegalus]
MDERVSSGVFKEQFAFLRAAIENVLCEFTDSVDKSFSHFQLEMCRKEKEIESLRLRLEISQSEVRAERGHASPALRILTRGPNKGNERGVERTPGVQLRTPVIGRQAGHKEGGQVNQELTFKKKPALLIPDRLTGQISKSVGWIQREDDHTAALTKTFSKSCEVGAPVRLSPDRNGSRDKWPSSEWNRKDSKADSRVPTAEELVDRKLVFIKEEGQEQCSGDFNVELFGQQALHLKVEDPEQSTELVLKHSRPDQSLSRTHGEDAVSSASGVRDEEEREASSGLSFCQISLHNGARYNHQEHGNHSCLKSSQSGAPNVQGSFSLGFAPSLACTLGLEAGESQKRLFSAPHCVTEAVTSPKPTQNRAERTWPDCDEHGLMQNNAAPKKKIYNCPECGKGFRWKSKLREHQTMHFGEKPYFCAVCGKRFSYKRSIQRHQVLHTGEKCHPCPECGKLFTTKEYVQKHQITHTGEHPYPCTQCGRRFKSKPNLKQHQRIHGIGKSYCCSKCGRSFKWKSSLSVHLKVHSAEVSEAAR